MSNEISKKGWDFWAIFTLLVVMMGFIMTIMFRMATKADIARVEANIAKVEATMATKADKADIARVEANFKADIARVEFDIKEISRLLIDHIKDGHKHRRQKREPASEPSKSKSK